MQILLHKKGKVNSYSDIWEKSINKDWQEVCRSTALHHQPVTPHSLPDGHLLPDLLQCSLSTTIQRETKLFLGADNEETAELTVPMYDFGDWASRMKAYRKKNHITQQELAQLMGVKHFTLRSWEQKQAKPPYNVWRLHKHLFDDSIKLT